MRALFCFLLWCCVVGDAVAQTPVMQLDAPGLPTSSQAVVTKAVQAIARLVQGHAQAASAQSLRRVDQAVTQALQTEGYFSANVEVTPGSGNTDWHIAIVPGARVQVESVTLTFSGAIMEPQYAERRQSLIAAWTLPTGKPFVNGDWASAKDSLLAGVSSREFLLAHITQSQARIDADHATAALVVNIDSGPRVHLGPLSIQGAERINTSLVRRYVDYTEGDLYQQQKLDRWQQQLQSASLYRGAFVTLVRSDAVTPDTKDVTLPVLVRVVEAAPRQVAGSLGANSDVGIRVEGLYTQNGVLGLPLTMEAGAGVDRTDQRAYLDFRLPPDADGNRDSYGLLAEHTDIQGLDNRRVGAAWTRTQTTQGAGRVQYERQWGVLVAHDRISLDGGDTYELPSATLTGQWIRRDVDNIYNPRSGNLIAVGAGVGERLDDWTPYTRLTLRAQTWLPLFERDFITVRGEVGRVWTNDIERVPSDFGFRIGGAQTLRGYTYDSIGLKRDDATIGASALAVGSIEYDHYFTERWGMGVFLDAGDASTSFGAMDVALGYGAGLRVRTPAGPLMLDLAYGQRDHDVKISFSLGVAF